MEPRTHLLGVHVAVVVQVAVVHGEPGGEPGPHAAAEAGVALEALAHHQHGVVERALGVLRQRVHPDHEDDVHDDLEDAGEGMSASTCEGVAHEDQPLRPT